MKCRDCGDNGPGMHVCVPQYATEVPVDQPGDRTMKQADVFECRYCGRQVDFLKPYHSDERGLWHWECGTTGNVGRCE